MPWARFTVEKVHPEAIVPFRGTPESAGYDLFALEDIVLKPGEDYTIPLGLKFKLPEGYYGQLKVRSGHARKRLMEVHAGTIDRDYPGEVMLLCRTRSKEEQTIPKGTACAQVVLIPVDYRQQRADEGIDIHPSSGDESSSGRNPPTRRGGFGSTDAEPVPTGSVASREHSQRDQSSDSSFDGVATATSTKEDKVEAQASV